MISRPIVPLPGSLPDACARVIRTLGRGAAGMLLALSAALGSHAAAQTTNSGASDAPIVNWRLPSFTPEGHREWLVRGTEARITNEGKFRLTELTLTIFTGDATNRPETILLSPTALVDPEQSLATGEGPIRLINDRFEASGTGWRYAPKEKKVSITNNVRVVFRAELKDILK